MLMYGNCSFSSTVYHVYYLSKEGGKNVHIAR